MPNAQTVSVDGESVIVMGRFSCLVQSRSYPKQYHAVEVNDSGKVECTCTGFMVRKSCRHATAIRRWLSDEADVALFSVAS